MQRNFLVAFDCEKVLIDGEFFPSLANKLGKGKEVEEITLKGIRGEIRWEDGFYKRVEMLKGAPYETCLEVANSLPIMKGAKETIEKLHNLGIKTIMITGGFSLLANRVKAKLGIDFVSSNEMVFKNGKLAGAKLFVDSKKIAALSEIRERNNLKDAILLASIVDGANDLTLFDEAKLKIAFNAQEIVKRRADIVISEKDLRKILPHVEEVYFKYANAQI